MLISDKNTGAQGAFICRVSGAYNSYYIVRLKSGIKIHINVKDAEILQADIGDML